MSDVDLKTDRLPVACLAPPLTGEKLARYKVLAAEQGGEIGSAMTDCLRCVEAWWELPESRQLGKKWAAKIGAKDATITVTPLEVEHVAALDSVTPWPRELDTLSRADGTGLFDIIPAGETRDAAFMLLWYAKEIALDREPVTQEKLSAA